MEPRERSRYEVPFSGAAAMDKQGREVFDLGKLEDVFQCIDALTRASAALAPINSKLAAELARIGNTLIAFSQSETPHVPPASHQPPDQQSYNDHQDLTAMHSKEAVANHADNGDEDVIIDVITGKPI